LTYCGQLILTKISKFDAIRCQRAYFSGREGKERVKGKGR